MAYESPSYDLIKKIDGVELRFYHAFTTVTVEESSLAGNRGFSELFHYISGGNHSQTKMSMTVPVINSIDHNQPTMEFVIPQAHRENIPQPLGTNMKINTYPSQHVLVKNFTGFLAKEKLSALEKNLMTIALQQSLTISGSAKIARYNSPFSLPFLRHNELWLTVILPDSAGTNRIK
jgi:hypothetical protein